MLAAYGMHRCCATCTSPLFFFNFLQTIFLRIFIFKIWDVVVVEPLPGANPEVAKATAVAAQAVVTG